MASGVEELEARLEAMEKLLEAIMEKCVEIEESVKEISMLLQLKEVKES